MNIRKIKFKLKNEKCWCYFFAKLTKVSLKYKSNIYAVIPEYDIRIDVKEIMELITIPDTIYIKKNNLYIDLLKYNNSEELNKKLDEIHKETTKKLKEIEIIIEIEGEDEDKAMEGIISEFLENIL